MSKKNSRITKSERLFNFINNIVLTIIALIAVYPLWFVFISAVSHADQVDAGRVLIVPINFTLDSIKYIISDVELWRSYGNTLFITIIGTAINLIFTATMAYALSKKYLKGVSIIMFLVVVTMWLKPGIIPMYLNFKSLGVLNSRLGLIFGFSIMTFNLILLRTFFSAVPQELEESTKIDGGNHFQILWHIYVPLSKSALVTVGLFYAIQRWNGYFWAMTMISDFSKQPLQVYLRRVIILALEESEMGSMVGAVSFNTIIYSTIAISVIPMLLVFPFIQKYFKKGVMIGSVKG